MQVQGSMSAGDPLASPLHYHGKFVPPLRAKSFAASTHDQHVQPLFEDILLRSSVLKQGKQVMVFTLEEVGKLSSTFFMEFVWQVCFSLPFFDADSCDIEKVRNFS